MLAAEEAFGQSVRAEGTGFAGIVLDPGNVDLVGNVVDGGKTRADDVAVALHVLIVLGVRIAETLRDAAVSLTLCGEVVGDDAAVRPDLHGQDLRLAGLHVDRDLGDA